MMQIIFFLYLLSFISSGIINPNSIFDYSHSKNEPLNILAGSLSSLRAIIPFEYTKLQICKPQKYEKAEDTLGEILTGESLYSTGYLAYTNKDEYCQTLCYNNFTQQQLKTIQKLIMRHYSTNWFLDKLPAGLILYDRIINSTKIRYFRGIPLGFINGNQTYIYNHLQFHILLNEIDKDRYNVVGFNILPISIKHNNENATCGFDEASSLNNFNLPPQPLNQSEILFTYDVVYEFSDITLSTRWDHYNTSKRSIHWTGMVICEVILITVTLIVICVLRKNLNTDITSYNYRVSQLEEIQDYDWKQVSGDVFRPPNKNVLLLSVMLGTGAQLLSMFTISLFLGIFGYMNPEKRINIINIGLLVYCFSGLLGGYISAKFYRFYGGTNWIKSACFTSLFFPGMLIGGYLIVNCLLIYEKSNAAVNFGDILSLFVLWIFCTFPLILLGSFFGFKSNKINLPFEINKIPNIIPEKPWYLHYRYITFLTGLVGFATIFIELNYVMVALWRHQIYFLGAFLWIAFFLFIIVVGEMTILVVYFNLCYGDYNWWWKSFIVGGSPVIYFILYTIIYFFYLRLESFSAIVVYFGIMALISCMAMLICGAVSVFFSLGFIFWIYSRIAYDDEIIEK